MRVLNPKREGGGREMHVEWAASSISYTWQAYGPQVPYGRRALSTRFFRSHLNTHPCVIGKVWQEVPECSIPPVF